MKFYHLIPIWLMLFAIFVNQIEVGRMAGVVSALLSLGLMALFTIVKTITAIEVLIFGDDEE